MSMELGVKDDNDYTSIDYPDPFVSQHNDMTDSDHEACSS